MINDQIERAFKYHPPSGDQPQRYERLRAKAKELALLIQELCPASREASLALTHIENASMWANASIARHGAAPPVAPSGPQPASSPKP